MAHLPCTLEYVANRSSRGAIPILLLFGGSRRTAQRACRAVRGKGEVLAGTGPLGEEPRFRPGGNWTDRKTGRGKRGLFVEVMA